ncbi:S24 family peptidase (plasmid) [Rossellomorea sp. AcN35-11]|nr:hypothetical protein [Rossellomorea aquimaris]WJV32323.1 S24 family peptidase [Rossellomorea sp. AcN35-11]
MKKVLWSTFVVFCSTLLFSSNALAAANLYKIQGDSMTPLLQDGDVIELTSNEYKEGDMVLGRTKTGGTIVKTLKEGMLVGANEENSINFRAEEVEILGSVLKNENFESTTNISKQAHALGINSPIKSVYAGREYVLMLHENTAVTGFGSNAANVLGMSGGEIKSTGELVKITELSGFESIIPGADNAFGLRPDDTNEGIYHLTRLNQSISTNPDTVSTLVKDAALVGTADANPHQATAFIDEQGFVKTRGSDYSTRLGIGAYRPYNFYPDGGWTTFVLDNNLENWKKVLAPNGEPILYPTDTTTSSYFLTNDDNSPTGVSMISPAFEIYKDVFTIETRMRNFAEHPVQETSQTAYVDINDTSIMDFIIEVYDGNLTDTEINSGDHAPLTQWNNPHRYGHSYGSVAHRVAEINLDGATSKLYKVKISSKYVSWDMRIRDRIYFQNAKRILYRNTGGHFTIIDQNNNVFINRGYNDGLVQPVTFDGMGAEVDIVPESARGGGDNTFYTVLDTNGRLWTWDNTTATMLDFPADSSTSQPFYDNYEIIDATSGNGFGMAISKHKITGETNTWVWGSNSHGKLGVDSKDSSILTPMIVSDPRGNPLTNIQAIAAGQHFSVIVQNTSDGQLVWTSGRNNSGQLGGGTSLVVRDPQLVPGTSNTDRIFPVLTELLIFNDTEQVVRKTGGGVSYVKPATLHPSVNYYPKYFSISEYKINSPTYSHAVYISPDGSGHHTIAYNGQYDDNSIYPLRIDEGNRYRADGTTEFLDFKPLNGGVRDMTNIKKAIPYLWATVFLDNDGRVWSGLHPSYPYFHYVSGHGGAYNSIGEYNPDGNPSRATDRDPDLRPARIDFDTLENTKFIDIGVPTKANTTRALTHAISEDGYLYELAEYSRRLSYPEIDGKAERLFSGYHSLALRTTDNNIYVWGNNGNYRLGTGNNSSYSTPQLISSTYFNNEKIIKIVSNDYATLFLSESGNVYASGTNNFGLFGDPDIEEGTVYATPTLVSKASKIGLTDIVLGHDFAAGIDKEKRIWAWGYSANGSLGNGFTMERNSVGTALGNATPNLTITSPLKTYYLSENGETNFSLKGTITEYDMEDATINTTLLGSERELTIDSDSWYQDNYNNVVPLNWELNWSVGDFEDLTYQSLTKVTTLDEIGGLEETFFSAEIIVDNEIPTVPTWGDNCLLDNATGNEVSCQSTPIFQAGGTNGVNQPVRLYINAPQKIGENKAPVYPQISYRVKTKGGFYINDWSDWETVKTQNENGFYYDVFAGFKGEAQFKVRTIDLADNKSLEQSEAMYSILTDAGAEIDNLSISSSLVDNQVNNTLEFNGVSHSGTTITTFTVKRKNFITGDWDNLTDPRVTWEGATSDTNTYIDTSTELLGNTKYEYSVNAENSIGVGFDKTGSVITNPYLPENFMKKIDDNDHLIVDITQDKRNRGEILYRLVIEEVSSGQEKAFDYVSSSVMENVLFDIDNTQVPFNITNNKLKLTLLLLGTNGNFLTQSLDEDFIVNKRVIDDQDMPFVEILINEKFTQLTNDGVNEIDFAIFATDNVTKFENLEFQVSHNGNDWFGQKENGSWVLNHWTSGRKAFTEFSMGDETGRRALYVRARDEASNLGFTLQKITIADIANRGTAAETDPSAPTVYDSRELTNSLKASNADGTLHVNSPRFDVKIPIPPDGNIEEVQFSFDGVTWSPWERMSNDGTSHHTKSVILPYGDGRKAMMTRYRNKDGATTTVQSRDVIRYTLDTSPPNIRTKTKNGPLITNKSSISLFIFAKDNFSQSMKVSLDLLDPNLNYVSLQTVADGSYYFNEGLNIISIEGLVDGRNEITLRVYDEAGNYSDETINIIKKAP